VPGEDLAELIKRGPLPLADAADIGRQVAAALEAAHEQGVIHRDLKPANVRITPDGQVKVLDFGLAKALESATGSQTGGDAGMSPTITSLGTVAGVILGTAAYMAPEQARGKAVDKRADIWAYGCLLFEMLSGRRPFDGETISDTLAAVLARDPDWSLLPATTPSTVRHLVTRCLEKDPKRRLRDVGDARLELEEMLADRTASGRVRTVPLDPAPSLRPTLPRWAIGAMVGCVALGALGGALVVPRREAPSRGVVRLDLALPHDLRIEEYRVSPDGTMVAAIGAPRVAPGTAAPPRRIFLRRLDTGTMTALAGTDGATGFGFAPDSRAIGTTVPATLGSPQRNLIYVPIDGASPPYTLCPFNPRWSAIGGLSDGGSVVLQDGTDLVRVSSAGTVEPPVKVDLAGERGTISFARYALPGDGAILLEAIAYGTKGWYYRIGVLDLKTARVRFLFDDGGNPAYSRTGHIVFTRGDTLLAVPFDAKSLTLKGTPVALANGLYTEYGFVPARFELSNEGVLVHESGGRVAEGRRLGVIDDAGNVTPISDARAFQAVYADPSGGQRFVATITNGQGIDELHAGRLGEEGLRRVFAVPDADVFTPTIAPDGRTVVFGRHGRNAEDGVYVVDLDGTAAPRRIAVLPPDDIRTTVESVLPDASGVIVMRRGPDQNGDLYLLTIPAAGAPLGEWKPIVTGPGDESSADLSPDGRSIAYVSDESGRDEVYVASFGPGGTVGRPVRVTRTGVAYMTWSPDGRSIRYRTGGRAMEVPVATLPSSSIGNPRDLFDAEAKNVRMHNFFADGRELVLIRGENETDDIRRLSIVLGFSDDLVKKMAAAR
jgi:eukaryotic-like serine/threonine-protein kinase